MPHFVVMKGNKETPTQVGNVQNVIRHMINLALYRKSVDKLLFTTDLSLNHLLRIY